MEYLLQAGTDLAFLDGWPNGLGSAGGSRARTLRSSKLHCRPAAATMELGKDLDEFSVRASGPAADRGEVNGWDPDHQLEVKDSTRRRRGAPPQIREPYVGSGAGSTLTAVGDVGGRPPAADPERGQGHRRRCYADWAPAAVVARGTTDVDSDSSSPGRRSRSPTPGPASGNYLVTEVEHVYDRPGFVTQFTAGPARPAGLVDTLGAPAAGPGLRRARPGGRRRHRRQRSGQGRAGSR